MLTPRIVDVPIYRVEEEAALWAEDKVAVEEPLEIRLGYDVEGRIQRKSISITMRTPGHDAELALGFLYTEGIIQGEDDIAAIREEKSEEANLRGNVITLDLKPGVSFDPDRLERHFYTTSSCGVCGKASLEALRLAGCPSLPKAGPVFDAAQIHTLPEAVLRVQDLFARTGGLHAAALIDAEGEVVCLQEDVGRHNAVDKLIGACLLEHQLPLHDGLLLVSSRASFELIQKALRAGIPVLAAVGAPTSLAIRLARVFGMTLLGFVRNNRFNVYSGEWRVTTGFSVRHAGLDPVSPFPVLSTENGESGTENQEPRTENHETTHSR